ncbi:hypothetical protein LB452_13220 [Psychroflexus sp. CAK8W]|uniref:Uncharacterized protein n=1 Tax=Psychroflexus longus TaxID=2873596 RepID=A0ABS7XN59_9FLAO|nr:hypothetical protein [Psychroflexus longus]MBZ9779883.1 hypothetical protein [Psychroflexus longus]
MGFSSWLTQDTRKSIANVYSSRPIFTVYMLDNKGNVWEEKCYEGYCSLGGKDYYELMAEMNGKSDREDGIKLFFSEEKNNVLYPNIVQNIKDWQWKNEKPRRCPHQGYFY